LENNTKTGLKETESDGVDSLHLTHDRGQCGLFVTTVLNLRVP